jgi:hypothetical protein
MKKIKMKDTILSHYQKVHELEMDGITVRVWKPRTMQQLPAYMMKAWINYQAQTKRDCLAVEAKAGWRMGNPDYGLWDAQTVYHIDPRRKMLDIYIAALLVRPFSEQAFNYYVNQHDNIDDVNQRLMLMWDSRDFDSRNGTTTNYGMNGVDLAKYQNYIYQVREPERDEDIEDTSANYFGEVNVEEPEPENRRCVKFRVEDDNIVYNALMGIDEEQVRGGTELMHACAKVFCDFRKEHPEVTEMHFYTDELLDVKQ